MRHYLNDDDNNINCNRERESREIKTNPNENVRHKRTGETESFRFLLLLSRNISVFVCARMCWACWNVLIKENLPVLSKSMLVSETVATAKPWHRNWNSNSPERKRRKRKTLLKKKTEKITSDWWMYNIATLLERRAFGVEGRKKKRTFAERKVGKKYATAKKFKWKSKR